jgi:hypothetical protein
MRLGSSGDFCPRAFAERWHTALVSISIDLKGGGMLRNKALSGHFDSSFQLTGVPFWHQPLEARRKAAALFKCS